MFSLCEAMRWSHLPVAGGIYDQHPDLIDDWRIIFAKRAEKEAKQQEEDARRNRLGGKSPKVAGRR